MSVSADRWTCPECGVTEHLVTGTGGAAMAPDVAIRLAQRGHGERHAAERQRAAPITVALAEAVETLVALRVRLVVAPGDLTRVRELVKRRGVAIDVYAGDLEPGHGYVMAPRRGVRELSTRGDNPGDRPR